MENEKCQNQTAGDEPSKENASNSKDGPDLDTRFAEGLKEARQCCENVRRKAAGRVREVRETTLGDVFDRVIVTVKRHPRGSLAVAAALGFFMGRLFRR